MKPDVPGGSARPRESLDAAYFDGVFAGDPDPWSLGSLRQGAPDLARDRAAGAFLARDLWREDPLW